MTRSKVVVAMLIAMAFLVCMPTISAAVNPPPVQFFYVPIPEGQHLQALTAIQSGGSGTSPGNPMQSYISISAIADNTIVYYDQYENGFEPDIGNPLDVYSNSNLDGTQIWGDGDPSNGAPPGIASDIINEGTVIVLNNPVTTTDPITVIKYGGRDKIAATKTISVVRAGWSTGPNTLMADANEVYDTDNWGTAFRVPVGTDISSSTDFQMFEYTGMMIMAGQGGATVQIDADNSGGFETTVSLAEGQSRLVNGGVEVGARVSSNRPVQVDLLTGDISSNYESRFFRLLPTDLWSNSYYTPVSTPSSVGTIDGTSTTVWLYNPNPSSIIVQYERRTSTGITTTPLTVSANSYLKQVLPNGYGSHFYTTGGQTFYALSTTDSTNDNTNNGQYTGNQAWDWGFALVPETSLTPQLLIGLGIGRDPTSGTNPDENGNPVWVTPVGNDDTAVTVYVDFDADPTTGGLTDPNGNKYDVSYNLMELERRKVYDPNDDDQTGMLLYVLTPGVKLVGAWGQDPEEASAAAPGLDLGTGIPPLPLFDAGKTATLYEDRDNDGYVSPGDVLLYTIVINNIARAPVPNMLLQDAFPVDAIYVEDSTNLTKSATGITTAIPDSGTTPFPLDEGGVILDNVNALPVGGSYTVTFQAIIKDFVDLTPGMTEVVNTGNATAVGTTIDFEARTPIYGRIGDFVWADQDLNGTQDAGELGVANVTVNLLDGEGNPVLDVFNNPVTTVTNATGFYQFIGLLPGNYSVEFIKPEGYDFTLQDQGTNDTLDSDADTVTGRTSVIMLAAGESDQTIDAGIYQLIPAVDIEKYTYGEDADDPTGPFIPVGVTVAWTYNVTNNGNVNLTNVVVSDNMGITPIYTSGDNGDGILQPGEVWVYSATGTAIAGQYANIGNVTADYNGIPVNDSDPSHYFGANYSIDIEKYTNGEDADDPTGPFIPVGSTVTWIYNVTNTGNVNLTKVFVLDNQLGPTLSYVGGDNGDGILQPGEVWLYNASGVATEGQYSNIGLVYAYFNSAEVSDSDPSHYFGSNSSVDIEKSTNGEDADSPTGPYVPVGSEVTWTYNVTNTGNVNLTVISVVDDILGDVTSNYTGGDTNGDGFLQPGEIWTYTATGTASAGQYANIGNVTATPSDYEGTPVTDEDPSHYYGSAAMIDIEKYTNGEDADSPTGPYVPVNSTVTWTYNVTNPGNVNLTDVVVVDDILGTITNLVSGDTNNDRILEPGEVWTYTATGTATAGQYANIGNVTATPSDYEGTPVTDEDPSHYYGSAAMIDIEKYTNGEDADSPTGPYVPVNSTVTWTYNVTNPGNVNLTVISVMDNIPGVTPAYVSGDANGDSILQPGEVWTYTAVGTATEGQYANIGNVTATPSDYEGDQVTDEDPSHYYGSSGSIDIEKYTNGEDADSPTGPYVPVNSTVTWTYNVTNTGNVNLTIISVLDNIPGVTPAYVSGDANGDSILQPGEVWTYTAVGTATEGQYANVGNVTATPSDYEGDQVTDEDPSHYYGSAAMIDIEKYTNGEDADSPTGPYVPVNSTVTWTYNVTNTGNVNLTIISVLDNMGVSPVYVSGDANGDGILQPGEVWTYTAVGTATEGQYANVGNVTATPSDYEGDQVTDEDPSHYYGSAAMIDIEKYTNGEDADSPTGPYVPVGSEVTWTYNVTNTGNVNLTIISVLDNIPGVTPAYVSGDANGDSILQPGEVWTYTAVGTATEGQYANVGNVTATPSDYEGTPVTDEDPSHHYGSSGSIDIEKYTNGEDADSPTGPYVPVNSTVTWTYNVTNTGNVNLTIISVLDNIPGVTPAYVSGDTNGDSILQPGEVWTYTAVGTATEGQYANVGNVTATPSDYEGTPVTDEDPSHYYGSAAMIDIEKYTNGEDADSPTGPYVPVGSEVTWTYNVTNTGNVNLTIISVLDNMGVSPVYVSGDTNGDGILQPGEVWTYTAVGTATEGQYANVGNVTATPSDYEGTPVTDEDPSHYYGSSGSIDIEKYTNGEDADSPTGPFIPIGSTVTWTYNVTNTGNVDLTNVVVADNMGVTPTYVSGDNGDGILQPGEVWVYNATGTATVGQYANIGNVSADYSGTPVNDSDPSHYFGLSGAIDIEKYVWNGTGWEDADTPTGPSLSSGPVKFKIIVTNIGNVELTNIVVTDDKYGPVTLTTTTLGVGASTEAEYDMTWASGQQVNTAGVEGYYGDTKYTDSDDAHYYGPVSQGAQYDNVLSESSSCVVFSTTPYLAVGKSKARSRDVMLFDLSMYNKNDTISQATLSLFWYYPAGQTRASDTVVEIYRPERWDPRYVTWFYRLSRTAWNPAGGHWFDKNGVSQGSVPYASVTFPAGTVPDNQYHDFDVTQLVQEYISGTYENTGFFLKAKTESGNYIAFYSSEWSNPDQRPKLTVALNTAPAPLAPPVVDNPPVAEAGADQTATTGIAVTFDGNGSTDDNAIVSYSWDFGDGTTAASGVTPAHTYATAGTYTVNLTVTDTIGQTDSDTMEVVVSDPTTTITTTDCVSYAPVYDNRMRQSSPSTVYATSNYIDVGKLSTTSYRDVMLFDLSAYKPTDTISQATLSLCWYYGSDTRTSDTVVEIYRPEKWDSKYVTWNTRMSGTPWTTPGGNWFDKNGASQGSVPYASVTFPSSTMPDNKYYDFDVTQLVQEYISGTYENTGFFLKARTESGNYITFYSSDWPNADQRPKLTVCLSGASAPLAPPVVDTPPVAEAGADKNATTGIAVTFDGSGSTDDNTIVSYSWDFGDGTAEASGVSPAHTYATAGTYTVTLTVTDTIGQTDSDTMEVLVSEPIGSVDIPPVADAGADKNATTGIAVTFDGSGSTDDNTIVSYSWDFGDGTAEASGVSPAHTYATAGTYTVTLTVTDTIGQNDSDTMEVVVSDPIGSVDTPPVADAGADKNATTGIAVTFDGSGSTDDKTIASYSWDFGDGTAEASGVSPAHTYATAGTYTVTLTVTDTIGQTDSDTMEVLVSEPTSSTGSSVSYTAAYDNRLRQSSPNTVLAGSNFIDVGRLGTTSYRDVILFDLSTYNATDTISQATLSLYWYYGSDTRTSDTVVEIYRPEKWDPKYVTWNTRMSGMPWTTAGGHWFDKNNVTLGSTPYASVTFPASTVPDNKYYEFDVTQLVQEYISGTYDNTGFFLKAKTESGNYIAFYSSEWSNADQRPKLTIVL